MNKVQLHKASAIIWDLDNTLYRFHDAFTHACDIAAGRTAIELGLNITPDDATAMATESFAVFGYSGYRFIYEHGLDKEEFHFKFHEYLDETVIHKAEEEQEYFAGLPLDHCLLTHGSREWAIKTLRHIGLKSFFKDSHILGLEDYDYQKKNNSKGGFQKAIDTLGTPISETIIVEDSVKNLPVPHEMGLITVLIHHGRPVDHNDHPYIDYQSNSSLSLLKAIKEQITTD